MVNFVTVSGYSKERGCVADSSHPQFLGFNLNGEHYLVKSEHLDRAVRHDEFVGKISLDGRVVEKVHLPREIYHLNSYDLNRSSAKVTPIYNSLLIKTVMMNGKRVEGTADSIGNESIA